MIREDFTKNWFFKKGVAAVTDGLFNPDGKKDYGVKINLPHDAMICEKPVPDAAGSNQTGFYPGGEYTYTKIFAAPPQWEKKDVFIYFGGVYQYARVYLNGNHLKTNLYGYQEFYVKLNDYLKYDEENILTVIVNNPTPNSRWYTGSGIYRDVQLLSGGPVYIKEDGVRIQTLTADEAEATVKVETRLLNITGKRKKIALALAISFGGNMVKEDTVSATVFPGEETAIRQNVSIKNPRLWSPDKPDLYEFRLEVYDEAGLLDCDIQESGIRTLALNADCGLRLNGKKIKLKGSCIHHDYGIIGAKEFPGAADRRAKQLKEAGFNAVRSSHNPMSREMLCACDRHGLLVMDELSDMWFSQKNANDFSNVFDVCWKENVRQMVNKNYNHPCVVMYSIGNEIPEIGSETGGRMSRRLCSEFYSLDPSRYTVSAISGVLAAGSSLGEIVDDVIAAKGIDLKAVLKNSEADTSIAMMNQMMSAMDSDEFTVHPLLTEALEEAAQACDIAGFNYLTGRHIAEKTLHPNKPVLGTETYPADIVRLWDIAENNEHVLGDFTWTGYDYLGEAGAGIFYYDGTGNFDPVFPNRTAYLGDIDITGERRPISYLRQIVYGDRSEPYIGVVRPHRYGLPVSKTAWMFKDNVSAWTFPGCEGMTTEVDIYSPDPACELFLNGKSLGKKLCGKEAGYIATWTMEYTPGQLCAVSYRDGKETGRYVLETADTELALGCCVETEMGNSRIRADGEDIAYVRVFFADKNGLRNPGIEQEIEISVEGEGTLEGFGSGNPAPGSGYDGTICRTYRGSALAVIRSTGKTGRIKVRFSCPGMETEEIILTAE